MLGDAKYSDHVYVTAATIGWLAVLSVVVAVVLVQVYRIRSLRDKLAS